MPLKKREKLLRVAGADQGEEIRLTSYMYPTDWIDRVERRV